jgi:hypothetical protein
MPLRPAAFANLARYVDSRIDLSAFRIPELAVDFDWGFDVDVPWERLSIFARHMDTAAPIARMPVFALVEFGLSPASSAAIDDPEVEARIAFPRLPLGVVSTDHVGYGSFDLWPLRNVTVFQSLKNTLSDADLLGAGQPRLALELTRLLVLPYKDPTIAFDALKEGDIGPDFLCLRMDLDVVMLANREVWPPMPAMQTPGIEDWRLSPGSFSMAGALLIGEDGCETLLPANLATRMVRFRQLVRTSSETRASRGRETPRVFEVPGFSGVVRLGYSVNYHSEWFPVGHSLGQIAYSLPLAPGEKMKIAVVDWSRRDAAKRSEQTTEKEDIQHAALRDRTLTEAVQMVVRESQSGSSFMAGGALSAGAGIPIGPVSLGVGGAFGAGGASTDSEGMRSIVGDTTQKISDAFHQASSAQRELNSTVVVQADQAEAAEARTRVVANYNHSHALTILYYEVLQHHRVLTKPVSVRPVVFLKHEATPFVFPVEDPAKNPDYSLIQLYKQIISASLLDESLRGCLDVVQKLSCFRQNFKAPPTYLPTDDFVLNEFLLKIKTGASAAKRNVTVRLILKDGDPVPCYLLVAGGGPFQPPKVDANLNDLTKPFRVASNVEHWFRLITEKFVRWGNIAKIELWQGTFPNESWEGAGEDPWDIESIHACTNAEPLYWVLFNGAPPFSPLPHNGTMQLPVQRYVSGPNTPEEMLTDEERCCLARLIDHLNAHAGYYWRAIWLAENPADRAVRFDEWKVGGTPLLDVVENVLLDVDGEYLVLPVVAGADRVLDKEFETRNLGLSKTPYLEYVEQLLTVPARGVFAEAKLGHCNASELIDPSRFWDWQTSPIPDNTPDISPVSTDSRYQDSTKGLAATAFPTPIVNIVNPQSLPDPTGFTAASGVLSALGSFRDMSGIKELGSYLEKLSNNATQLASQGMKNAQTSSLLNTIRSAKELPPEKRAELMSELLTGQVKNQAAPPTAEPEPKSEPPQPPVAQQSPGESTGTPAPKPLPKPSPPTRTPTVSSKTKKVTFMFAFEPNEIMFGTWTVTLESGNDRKGPGLPINTSSAISSSVANEVEFAVEDSFGGDDDVKVEIHGTIIGLPVTLSAGTKKYAFEQVQSPLNLRAAIKRADWKNARTVKVLQPTEAVSFTIERSVSDTNAETKLAEHTAGLKVGVENQVEVSGTAGIASGKEAVKVAVEGTYGYKTSDQTLVQSATGSVERVTFNAYKLKGTPTITPLI